MVSQRVLKLFILKEETEQEGDVNKNNRGVGKLPDKANFIVHYWWCVDAFFMNAETSPEISFFILRKDCN